MDRQNTLTAERLHRLADDLAFRHYVVCPHCSGPMPIFPPELSPRTTFLSCPHCDQFAPLDRVSVQEYRR